MNPTRKIKNNVTRYNGSLSKNFLALKFAFEAVTHRIWKSTQTAMPFLYTEFHELWIYEKNYFTFSQGDFPN